MKSAFDATVIGQIPLKNRLIRSATFEYIAGVDGRFTDFHQQLYKQLADGGIGAIITGMVAVDEDSRVREAMVKAYSPEFESDLRRLKAGFEKTGCRLIPQISHCGVKATCIGDGGAPFGPSAFDLPSGAISRAMTKEHIARVVGSFAEIALRCKRAGADGVQLHGAHGYLLSQFLSPYYNKRTDEYGGDIAGRSRIVMEVYDAVRAAVGSDYPVWIKINSNDLTNPGLTVEECAWVCRELDKRGIDAIEISGGANAGEDSRSARIMKKNDPEGFFAQAALDIAGTVKASVISVGGHRTVDAINAWLNKGDIAAVSLCRPLLAEPDLVNKWCADAAHHAQCISCNRCYQSTNGIRCQVFKGIV